MWIFKNDHSFASNAVTAGYSAPAVFVLIGVALKATTIVPTMTGIKFFNTYNIIIKKIVSKIFFFVFK